MRARCVKGGTACHNCGVAMDWTEKLQKLASYYGKAMVGEHLRCPVCLTIKQAEQLAQVHLSRLD